MRPREPMRNSHLRRALFSRVWERRRVDAKVVKRVPVRLPKLPLGLLELLARQQPIRKSLVRYLRQMGIDSNPTKRPRREWKRAASYMLDNTPGMRPAECCGPPPLCSSGLEEPTTLCFLSDRHRKRPARVSHGSSGGGEKCFWPRSSIILAQRVANGQTGDPGKNPRARQKKTALQHVSPEALAQSLLRPLSLPRWRSRRLAGSRGTRNNSSSQRRQSLASSSSRRRREQCALLLLRAATGRCRSLPLATGW